jgi:hypothetical protein
VQGFWLGNLREGDNLKDRRIDGKIILKWILEKCDCGGMDWFDLAQDMEKPLGKDSARWSFGLWLFLLFPQLWLN